MLGGNEVGGFHHALVEAAQRGEGLEVCGFYKTEVVGRYAVDVVHDDPSVFADALPSVWSLTSFRLSVYLFVMVVVEVVDAV